MKILIYNEDYERVKESGVGKAIDHQKKSFGSCRSFLHFRPK